MGALCMTFYSMMSETLDEMGLSRQKTCCVVIWPLKKGVNKGAGRDENT